LNLLPFPSNTALKEREKKNEIVVPRTVACCVMRLARQFATKNIFPQFFLFFTPQIFFQEVFAFTCQ